MFCVPRGAEDGLQVECTRKQSLTVSAIPQWNILFLDTVGGLWETFKEKVGDCLVCQNDFYIMRGERFLKYLPTFKMDDNAIFHLATEPLALSGKV